MEKRERKRKKLIAAESGYTPSPNMLHQISRIRVAAKQKTRYKSNFFFLQCSILFLRTSVSSLLNKECIVGHIRRMSKALRKKTKLSVSNLLIKKGLWLNHAKQQRWSP